MATFLAIYSRSGVIDLPEIKQAVADFTMNGMRHVITSELPGMLLCVVSKFSKAMAAGEDSLSCVSGHISFDALTGIRPGTTVEAFAQCISEQGCGALRAMEGAFAALHYDRASHTLTLANDKFGIFPFFMVEQGRYVAVSNEYQPLMQLLPAKKRMPDHDAIAEFFTLGVTLGNKTFYREVRSLSAASCVVITANNITVKKYWQPEPFPAVSGDSSLIAKDLYELFKKINREYVDAGLADLYLLSAGADSRLIVATLTEAQRQHMEFYTSNLSFLDPAEDKDVLGATQIAKRFGLKHRVEKISFYENQFGTSYFDTDRALRASHVYGGWHGGELLGGYGLKAAPVQRGLTFGDVDKKLKTVFSWRFRFKLTGHPYKNYLQEKEKFPEPLRDFLFITEQLTRSFFTSIYGGTRGHWAQPYQLANHGFSPFWDSRFLQMLMQVPVSLLADYALYNDVLKFCAPEFLNIGSNSPLTQRPDSVLPQTDTGVEPKSSIPDTHSQAFAERLKDKNIWHRNFYRRRTLSKILANGSDELSRRWLDFETWYAHYAHSD